MASTRPAAPTLNDVWPGVSCSVADLVNAGLLRPALVARMTRFMHSLHAPFDYPAQALRDLDEWIRPEIPAYGDLPPITGLRELPLTRKREIRAAPERFRPRYRDPQEVWIKRTTGSTGAPFCIDYSAAFHYETTLLTVPRIACRLDLLPRKEHRLYSLTVRDKPGAAPVVRMDSTGFGGPGVRVGIDTADPESVHRFLEAAGRVRPFCISSSPAVLAILAEAASARAARATRTRLIVSGGAVLPAATRARLEQLFGAVVCSAYGLAETGVVASECREGRLHLGTSDCHVEIWREDAGVVSDEGAGEIVLTSTANTAMPFLRYRTGDLGRISREPCPCGEPSPVLLELSGRVVPVFPLPGGRLFSPTQFRETFAAFPWLREFQVVQEAVERVRVLYQPDGAPIAADEAERFRGHFAGPLGPGVEVLLQEHAFTPDGKFQRYRTLVE